VLHVAPAPLSGAYRSSLTLFELPARLFNSNQRAIALFWVIALPAAYLAIATGYRLRAKRRGVASRPAPYVVVGIALLLTLVITSPGVAALLHLPHWVAILSATGDASVRGLEPLLTLALGLFALAFIERSRTLLAFAGVFLAVALFADLYDIENLTRRIGLGLQGQEVNVIVAGGFLLAGGLGFGLARLRSGRAEPSAP
jgi:hypothetical protein